MTVAFVLARVDCYLEGSAGVRKYTGANGGDNGGQLGFYKIGKCLYLLDNSWAMGSWNYGF